MNKLKGLKILWSESSVRVRVPPPALSKTFDASKTLRLRSILRRFNGRLIVETGDGTLSSSSTSVDAVKPPAPLYYCKWTLK